MDNIERVREFHTTYNCFINQKTGVEAIEAVDKDLAFIRFKITREEIEELTQAILNNNKLETLDALTDIHYLNDGSYLTYGLTPVYPAEYDNIVAEFVASEQLLMIPVMLDGLTNGILQGYITKDVSLIHDALNTIRYLVDQAYTQFGFSPELQEAAQIEVHRSNMSKLGEDGKPIFREDGKVMKGPNYFKPDLSALLAKYSEAA